MRDNKRLYKYKEASEYTSMKRQALDRYAEKIGAIRRFGRSKFYDMDIIDADLNKSKPGEDLKN